jgi:hypothetical protein
LVDERQRGKPSRVATGEPSRGALPVLDQFFLLQHAANLFESYLNLRFREPDVVKPMHIRKFLALEQLGFMDNVQAWMKLSCPLLVLAGQYQDGKSA